MLHICKKCSVSAFFTSMEHWTKRLFVRFWKDGFSAEIQARMSRSSRFLLFLHHNHYNYQVSLKVFFYFWTIVVDCEMPRNFYNGHLGGHQSTYGAELHFKCHSKATAEGDSTKAVCLENGKWSHPPPKCWSMFLWFIFSCSLIYCSTVKSWIIRFVSFMFWLVL